MQRQTLVDQELSSVSQFVFACHLPLDGLSADQSGDICQQVRAGPNLTAHCHFD